MTRYAKINFPLQVSSTSSYGDQLLAGGDAEEFSVTTVVERLGIYVPSYAAMSGPTEVIIPDAGWTDSTATILVTNVGDYNGSVYFNRAYGAASYATPERVVVISGRSALFQFDGTYAGPLFNDADWAGVLGFQGDNAAGNATTFDITILLNNS